MTDETPIWSVVIRTTNRKLVRHLLHEALMEQGVLEVHAEWLDFEDPDES